MAERARAELGGAVHPADDAAGGELVGDPFDQRRVVELFDGLAVLARRPRQLLGVDRRSPERMIGHLAVGVAEVDAVGVQRRAERAAGIAGSGRHEHALEAGLGEDPRVGDAVERDAAAEAEIRQAGFAMQRARRCPPACPRARAGRWRRNRRSAGLRRSRGRSARTGCAAGRTARRIAANTIARPSSGTRSNPGRARTRRRACAGSACGPASVMRRTPVGGEPHHLVLVLVHREAEIGGERRVQHAERVRDSGSRAGA